MPTAPTEATDPGADPFTAHRRLLFTVAYEMLGSAADAEDVVQETWLRWSAADRSSVLEPRAYLIRITTRLALNQLRTLSRRREDYIGPWLPEPLLTTPDVADDVALADSLTTAMLLVLETLGSTERAVFVLREVFGFDHDEIAVAVDKTPAAVRQIAHRARQHVAARRPRQQVDAAELASVLERFRVATTTGDIQGLVDVFDPDVVLLTDGGGRVSAARNPIVGLDKVLRFLAGIHDDSARLEAVDVNGSPGALFHRDGQPDAVGMFDIEDGRVTRLYLVRNPEKLTRIFQRYSLGR